MEWFLAILAVIVIGIAAVAGSGRLGQFVPGQADRTQVILPDRDLTSADVKSLRFAVVPRGYSMSQVDEVLARLQSQLDAKQPSGQQTTSLTAEPEIMVREVPVERRDHDGSDEASHG